MSCGVPTLFTFLHPEKDATHSGKAQKLDHFFLDPQQIPSHFNRKPSCWEESKSDPKITLLRLSDICSGILSVIQFGIYSDILSVILSGKHSDITIWDSIWHSILLYILNLYLKYILIFSPALYLAFHLTYILALYLTFHLTYILTFNLACYLAFCLRHILTFYLTFYLTYILVHLAVEVQRRSLS